MDVISYLDRVPMISMRHMRRWDLGPSALALRFQPKKRMKACEIKLILVIIYPLSKSLIASQQGYLCSMFIITIASEVYLIGLGFNSFASLFMHF